jgi:hypothetical protein
VAKVGTSKAGGTISQQAAVQPWLVADAHVNKGRIYIENIGEEVAQASACTRGDNMLKENVYFKSYKFIFLTKLLLD